MAFGVKGSFIPFISESKVCRYAFDFSIAFSMRFNTGIVMA